MNESLYALFGSLRAARDAHKAAQQRAEFQMARAAQWRAERQAGPIIDGEYTVIDERAIKYKQG